MMLDFTLGVDAENKRVLTSYANGLRVCEPAKAFDGDPANTILCPGHTQFSRL